MAGLLLSEVVPTGLKGQQLIAQGITLGICDA